MIGLELATVRFGARTIFEALSFTVPTGECMALLGPNGRGKTTALRAMLGFQPLVAGRRLAPLVVGYVPQHTAIAHPYAVREVVVMGRAISLGLFSQPSAADYKIADEALERVGATRHAAERFDRLSGGERQLVLLARALATGSDVLVLDEPGAALDLANQHRLLDMLDALRKERSKTIVFTTHDPNHALLAADHALLMMPSGEAPLFGRVEEVVSPQPLQQLYGVLMQMVPVSGADGNVSHAVLPAFLGRHRLA